MNLRTVAAVLITAVSASVLMSAACCRAAEAIAPSLTEAARMHGAGASDPAHAGIWKAVTPTDGSMRGEFGSNDPIGLAVGARIPSDCSINWVDPDFGKRYCFSSATSLVYFLVSPRHYLAEAERHWVRPQPDS